MKELPQSGPRGFTLVELLVVLAVVALLAGLATPAVGWALDRTRSTACLSNLREIGLAVRQYAGDHDQQLPDLAAGRNNRSEPLPVMDTVLQPYVTDARVFRCPADRGGLYERTGTSYFWNYLPVLQEDGSKNLRLPALEFALTGAQDPSRIPLVVDKEAFHRGDRSNVLYADGSARPLD